MTTSPSTVPVHPARPPRPPPILTSAPAASPPCVRPRPILKRSGGVPRDIGAQSRRIMQPCLAGLSGTATVVAVCLLTWLVVVTFSTLVRAPRTGIENGCQRSRLWDALVLQLATGLGLLGPSAYLRVIHLDDKTIWWLIIALAGLPAPVFGIHVLTYGCSPTPSSSLQRLVQVWTVLLSLDSVAVWWGIFLTMWNRRCRRLAGVDPVLPNEQNTESPI
jgi:hypothetical protein